MDVSVKCALIFLNTILVEKGATEDEMAGWHHYLDGHEFEQTLEVGDGQGRLACCSPEGHRVGHD